MRRAGQAKHPGSDRRVTNGQKSTLGLTGNIAFLDGLGIPHRQPSGDAVVSLRLFLHPLEAGVVVGELVEMRQGDLPGHRARHRP